MANLAADLWLDCESTIDATGFDTNDHVTQTGLWTVTNGHGTVGAGGSKTVPGTINAASDTGTKGLILDCNFTGGGTFGTFNLTGTGGPGSKAAISCGFWFQMPTTWVGSFRECDMFRWRNVLGTNEPLLKASDKHDGTTAGTIYIHTVESGYQATDVIIAGNTWYWCTAKYTQNVNGKARIYNGTTGAQVGSEQTVTAGNQPCTTFDFGNISGATGPFVGNMLFDNLLVDWTNAIYPLGPGSAAALGGGVVSVPIAARCGGW